MLGTMRLLGALRSPLVAASKLDPLFLLAFPISLGLPSAIWIVHGCDESGFS
jgi:hypothetical protein